jgi:hypothetical protein
MEAAFEYAEEDVVAAILLDARHPGRPPASLPSATAVPCQRGGVNELVPERIQPVHITARRIGDAGLIVEAGGTLDRRITILDELTSCA